MSTPIGKRRISNCREDVWKADQRLNVIRPGSRNIARASYGFDIVTAMLFHDMSAGTPRRWG